MAQHLSDLILLAVLVVAAVMDLRTGQIRNWLVYPAIAVGLALALAGGGLDGLKDHALAAGVGFGLMLICFAIGGMGGGDVKLMAAVGALGGFDRADSGNFIIYAMIYAFAVGAVLGILAAVWRKALGETLLRTWLGVRLFLLPGGNMAESVPKGRIKVPLGFATCLAVTWLLAENYSGVSLGMLISRWTGM